MNIIIIFFFLQTINVILNTSKSLIMVRTNNMHISAFINAVNFGFYVAVVKQISSLDLTVTIIITIITNLIGVYVTYWTANKLKKDNLWKIEIYAPKNLSLITGNLDIDNIPYIKINDKIITVYAYTQEHSILTQLYIEQVKAKYNITEITKRF